MPGYAELQDVKRAGAEMEGLAGGLAEIDEDVGAFGAAEDEALEFDGGSEETLVGADLEEGLNGSAGTGKGKKEEAAVGGVKEAEAIETWLDFKEGADFSVDENAVCGELWDPRTLRVAGDIVEELTVCCEVAVVEDERNLILAGR